MNFLYKSCKLIWQQKWLKPEKYRFIYKTLGKSESPPDFPFSKQFFGLKYQGNLNNNIEFNIFHHGAFEKHLLFFMRDLVIQLDDPKAIFLDIGANIGQHSLFMSNYCHEIHSFEPFSGVSKKLEHHIELNQLSNIRLHKVGLSDTNQEMDFFAPEGSNQGIGSFDPATIKKGNKPIGKLTLVRADDYLQGHQITKIDIVKMDVEGFEKLALAGMMKTLELTRPVLIVEISYGGELSFQSLAELQNALPENYQIFCFNTRKADGSKARRRGLKSRTSGSYQLIPYTFQHPHGQDDIIACPCENLEKLPLTNAIPKI